MPDADDTASPRDGRSSDGEPSTDENGSVVIFEFAVPAERFVLGEALRAHPDVTVEFERLIPTNHNPLPYLWTTDSNEPTFRAALAADSNVDRIEKVGTFDDGALYYIEWKSEGDGLLGWLSGTRNSVALLQTEGRGDKWTLKLRFPSRDLLADFRAFYEERDIDLRVIRLYDLRDPKLGQYNITQKQRETLVRALEMGHFEIPRDATLEEIADELGISPKSVSERLRRGQTNLIGNSLTIGQMKGVGLGEQ